MRNERLAHGWLLVAAGVVFVIILAVISFFGLDLSPKPRIGFVMTGAVGDGGWNGMHYSGVTSACEEMGAQLLIEENISEGTGQCAEAIHRLAEDGARMIILSSFGYPAEAAEAIAAYPDIEFYGISADKSVSDMTSYFGRVYQTRYLAGIVAGMQTQTDVIGYVAAMPNSEVNRGINAFALGVRSVNPDADVDVIFTGSWDDEDAERAAAMRLIDEHDADVLTYHQNRHTVAYTADEAGVYSIGYNETVEDISDRYLTAAVWNWDALYLKIIKEFVHGNSNNEKRYWFGLETGVVCLSEFSPLVHEETRLAVEAARNSIVGGRDVFCGVIYDDNGEMRCGEGEMLSDNLLFNDMDWYVDGVVIYE